jgi:predicted heme/steroid binding protein
LNTDTHSLSALVDCARAGASLESFASAEEARELGYWLRFFGVVLSGPAPELQQALASESAERPNDARLQRRARWLRDGTRDDELSSLDPRTDADQLHQRVLSLFRVESRVLETLSVNRIAQSTSLLLLIRATGKSQTEPALRFYDTYSLLSNALEWGVHSARGSRSVRRINEVHARYDIPAEGMKYILLETAFTWLHGAEIIAHRPLHEVERLGFFHAYIELGRALGVCDLQHDFAAMQAWVNDFNHTHRAFHPSKRDTFESILSSSLQAVPYANLVHWFRTCLGAAMDEPYLEAVGHPPVTPRQLQTVKRLLGNLGNAVERCNPEPLLRSLRASPARPVALDPEALGSAARSSNLPPQTSDAELPAFTWQQVAAHCHPTSLWVVIDGEVFDLTQFAALHPGGRQVLYAHAGKDATVAFEQARHPGMVQSLRRNYRIGRIVADGPLTEGD